MPYLYTTTEEMSRTGLPIVRPLFLEFPDATADKHPMDLDAAMNFSLARTFWSPRAISRRAGRLLRPAAAGQLVRLLDRRQAAAAAQDEQPRPGAARREGRDGAADGAAAHQAERRCAAGLRARRGDPAHPAADAEHEGDAAGSTDVACVPSRRTAPTKERTQPCAGSIYLDDGVTLDYQKGAYMREQFSCTVSGGHR